LGWYADGFDRLLNFVTPVIWFFATLVGLSLFVLRWKEPHTARPHRVILYPLTPILFCLSSGFLLRASVMHAFTHRTVEAWWTISILVAGIAVSLLFPPDQEKQVVFVDPNDSEGEALRRRST
jgi:amino acid transporter